MSWAASKASRVLAALLRIGWRIKGQSGSHRTLARDGWPDYVFAFSSSDEIGLGCWRAWCSGLGSNLTIFNDHRAQPAP